MKNYVIQQGDTFSSLAQKFKLKNEGVLKTYHNLHCSEENIMQEPIPGMSILIPEDPKLMTHETEYQYSSNINSSEEENQVLAIQDTQDSSEPGHHEEQPSGKTEKKQEKEDHKKENGGESNAHKGKYFVVQKGMCQCNQGFKFPKFKVTSHQKHYWNDAEGQADYLAVTEDDLSFDPPAMPFGNCKLKPTSGGYLPCSYAPAGKWQKPYEKVKVMGKSCLTEISELMCSIGGKITILKHGQQSEIGKSHVENANAKEQQIYNPIVNFDEFKEKILGKDFSDDYQ
ncbi:PAAR-like protein [Chryseobacterium contaminans]|uniref:PAAR-like protein n=1 Tax=Chryseobacterium contaminans TaxID=1423959 RepID=UPI003017EBE2